MDADLVGPGIAHTALMQHTPVQPQHLFIAQPLMTESRRIDSGIHTVDRVDVSIDIHFRQLQHLREQDRAEVASSSSQRGHISLFIISDEAAGHHCFMLRQRFLHALCMQRAYVRIIISAVSDDAALMDGQRISVYPCFQQLTAHAQGGKQFAKRQQPCFLLRREQW